MNETGTARGVPQRISPIVASLVISVRGDSLSETVKAAEDRAAVAGAVSMRRCEVEGNDTNGWLVRLYADGCAS